MLAELILEGLVAVLLLVTIGYCFVLNRRLAALRNGQSELHDVVRVLNEASEKARASVEQLRRSSVSIAEDLSAKAKAGRALADELGVIVESGNGLADRLAAMSAASRSATRKPDPAEALSRLDEGFRRQLVREGDASRDAATVKPGSSDSEPSAGNDLRHALRAMR